MTEVKNIIASGRVTGVPFCCMFVLALLALFICLCVSM
jgi:hypothetical protein